MIVFLLVVAILGGAGVLAARYFKPAEVDVPTVLARHGDFLVKTYTRGDMRTLRASVVLSPNIGASVTVTHMAAMGEQVKENDVLMEFDSAEQENFLESHKSEVDEAEQTIVKTKADMAIQTQQDKVDLMKAEFDVRRAELDVSKNELLSEIDARKNDLALEAARKRLAQLKEDVQSRARSSQADLAVAQEKLNKAKFDLRLTEQRLERLTVKAPLSGLVSVRQNMRAAGGYMMIGQDLPDFREGDQIESGNAVMDVVDTEQMEVAGKIPETERGSLHEGQERQHPPRQHSGRDVPGQGQDAVGDDLARFHRH